MSITALTVGKKHEPWVVDGIERYTKRLRKPYDLTWKLLPHSVQSDDAARDEESTRILRALSPRDHVILLDERGTNISSPQLATRLQRRFDTGESVVVVIGGAYGVNSHIHARADFTWSLSKLVFPHQLVRLILAEQIYRAQEISAGRPYHHS
ncbi:23S rRNA (pseudouridine(1915)-N(3))-methyltransferase RlmH [Nesterenkonia alba]|uniref:23S rRNA (pseudouridine(1915)-N(3))-methyltransferase RlmH n=1 Tax=Nesterenkonia alba TaxID=515814 RepID=UPI0003B64E47|nr:23S rRNA (pseudouridine(1915)-N(3))-methyltransferase RlmH [Nesterenkonia alba]